MFCPNCGSNVNENAAFCGNCGKAIDQKGNQGQHQTARRAQTALKHPEAIDENIPFMTSYLTFYLKGHIGIHSDHVDLTIPNTIFGLIPLGSNNRSIDVNQIVSPVSNFKVTPLTLILGFFLGIGGLLSIPEAIASVPSAGIDNLLTTLFLTLVGILLFLNSLQTTIGITLTSGEIIAIPLVVFEKSKADLIRERISQICSARTHDTNTRVHTERQTNQLIDALQNRA